MKRKNTLFTALLCGIMLFTGLLLFGCGKTPEYPAFKNPTATDGEQGDKYTISVISAGGLNLDNVQVFAQKDGKTVMAGYSKNGVISLPLDPDEYDLVVDETTLPAGYYIPEDTVYKTAADTFTAKVVIPSRVISTTATSDITYSVGDVIHDFSYSEVNGERYTLSKLFETKRAVVLNFWYTTCVPCQSEFPTIQKAYEAYADKLEVVALSATDSSRTITTFKNERNLTFHMAPDQAGITNLFGVSAFPTTVIVDCYGVIAYVNSGSETRESVWMALFNKYTSDSYTQEENSSDPNTPSTGEFARPDETLVMPSSAEIAAAINGEGTEGKVKTYRASAETDAEFSFPWLTESDDDGKYIYAANTKVPYSFATVYCELSLEAGDVLSYEYRVDTEAGNDVLYVLIDGALIAEHSGDSNGWATQTGAYVADHSVNITLSFLYMKDPLVDGGEDMACIRNINIKDVKDADGALDERVTAVDGAELSGGKYAVRLLAPGTSENSDIYYHVVYKNDEGKDTEALLLLDILKSTPWSEKHVGSQKVTNPEGNAVYASIYHISFWFMSNYENAVDQGLTFSYGKEHTDLLIDYYYLQTFSDNGYLPVNEELKNAASAFAAKYCEENDLAYYEDQWLEFCYFYKHHGDKHLVGGCNATDDPLEGLSRTNAVTLNGVSGIKTIVNITKATTHDGGGKWYKFVPSTTAIYHVYTTGVPEDTTVNSSLTIHDDKKNILCENDNDNRFDRFTVNYNHSSIYFSLTAGKTYYIQAATSTPGETGTYNLHVDLESTTAMEYLRVCSTGDGAWESVNKYAAIPVALNPTDKYYHAVENGEYASVIYIDFIHPNFLDQKENSLFSMVKAGKFNFTAQGGKNYTQTLLKYYNMSLAGKKMSDELYGLVEATQELVDCLNAFFLYNPGYGDGPEAYAWLMLADYYQHIEV